MGLDKSKKKVLNRYWNEKTTARAVGFGPFQTDWKGEKGTDISENAGAAAF